MNRYPDRSQTPKLPRLRLPALTSSRSPSAPSNSRRLSSANTAHSSISNRSRRSHDIESLRNGLTSPRFRFGYLDSAIANENNIGRRSRLSVTPRHSHPHSGRTSQCSSDDSESVPPTPCHSPRLQGRVDLTPPRTARPPSSYYHGPRQQRTPSPTSNDDESENDFQVRMLKRNVNNEVLNFKFWGTLRQSNNTNMNNVNKDDTDGHLPTFSGE